MIPVILTLVLMGAAQSPVQAAQDVIQWYTANSVTIFIIVGHLYVIARFVATKINNPTLNSILETLGVLIPPKYVPTAIVIPDDPSAPTDGGPVMLLSHADRHPAMRMLIRRQARKAGIEIPDEETMDDIVAECDYRRMKEKAGVLQDLFTWVVNNPEKVLAVIKMIMAIFAGQKPEVSDEV